MHGKIAIKSPIITTFFNPLEFEFLDDFDFVPIYETQYTFRII